MEIIHAVTKDFDSVISGNHLVLVDFWAPWCGHCRTIAPVMEQMAKDYDEKLAVVKVNVDDSQDLAIKFGVQSIPLVLLFKDGQLLSSHMGARPLGYYKQIVDEQL